MKKTASILVMAVMGITTAVAQNDNGFQKSRMGFKVSPNVSWMQPQDKHFISDGAALRFGFGFIADIFFAPNYAIGTGVNVYRNGGTLSYLELERIGSQDFIFRRERTYSNQYVEIPVTFKLRTNEIGYMTYWAQFGLGMGVNIGARGDDTKNYLLEQVLADGNTEWAVSERSTVFDENADLSSSIRLFRASMIFAAGVEYNLGGTTSVLFGVTYNNGITNSMARKDVLRTVDDGPVFRGPRPETVRLNSIANAIELNIGILF